MTLEICTEWNRIEYISAVCPYCHEINTYLAKHYEKGDHIYCSKCSEQFKLGEQE